METDYFDMRAYLSSIDDDYLQELVFLANEAETNWISMDSPLRMPFGGNGLISDIERYRLFIYKEAANRWGKNTP